MQEIRLRFSKTDTAKYISHLDTNRVFARAFARAKIPLWFTEGFNPHPYMSFSLPLSLGVESLCENVDIRILEDIPYDEIKNRMNEALPQGIRVVDVYDDFLDCHEIAYSDYVYKLEFADNDAAHEKIKSVLESDEILAQKKGKKGKRDGDGGVSGAEEGIYQPEIVSAASPDPRGKVKKQPPGS